MRRENYEEESKSFGNKGASVSLGAFDTTEEDLTRLQRINKHLMLLLLRYAVCCLYTYLATFVKIGISSSFEFSMSDANK